MSEGSKNSTTCELLQLNSWSSFSGKNSRNEAQLKQAGTTTTKEPKSWQKQEREEGDRVKGLGGDKMAEEKDLNWPPLTDTPKSQLSDRKTGMHQNRFYIQRQSHNEAAGGVHSRNNQIPYWLDGWHTNWKIIISQRFSHKIKRCDMYIHTHIHPVEYYSSINRKIFWYCQR